MLALREIERRLGVADRLAACLKDPRARERVQHRLAEIIRFRMLMLAAGYEDGNDAEALRRDPMFKLALDRLPSGNELCSQSAISRLENLPDVRAPRKAGTAASTTSTIATAAGRRCTTGREKPMAAMTRSLNAAAVFTCLFGFAAIASMTGCALAATQTQTCAPGTLLPQCVNTAAVDLVQPKSATLRVFAVCVAECAGERSPHRDRFARLQRGEA